MRKSGLAAILLNLAFTITFLSVLENSAQAAARAPVRSGPADTLNTPTLSDGANETAPEEPEEFKELIWNVEEGNSQNPIEPLVVWKAERGVSTATMTRIITTQDLGAARSIKLSDEEELQLREQVSNLALTIPSGPPTPKDECPHWVEIDTVYGRRLYCVGTNGQSEAKAVQNFLTKLNRMMGNR